MKPAGIWMKGCQSEGPASSTQTVVFSSSLRRLASTLPAEPAPPITQAKLSIRQAYPAQPRRRNRLYAWQPASSILAAVISGGWGHALQDHDYGRVLWIAARLEDSLRRPF